MRAILQIVKNSDVKVDGNLKSSIGYGYNILVGFTHTDTLETVQAIAKKIVNLRVFMDENEKMNLSIKDVDGEILSISQFTLYADVKKGNRPSFTNAMNPELANQLYEEFNKCLMSYDVKVLTGQFQSMMEVMINNYGPTTIIIDSEDILKK